MSRPLVVAEEFSRRAVPALPLTAAGAVASTRARALPLPKAAGVAVAMPVAAVAGAVHR